ncbi:hypothetical protein Tco_1484042 [Tanacetum coccineum]
MCSSRKGTLCEHSEISSRLLREWSMGEAVLGNCNMTLKNKFNTSLARNLSKQIYSPFIVYWNVLNTLGCDNAIENMLEVRVNEIGSNEVLFTSEAQKFSTASTSISTGSRVSIVSNYPIWEFIQKGNGLIKVSTDTNGQIRVFPPKIAEEILARKRERKVRTTLFMSIPEDHLAKFHKMIDAKEMWEAIKSRFGGNDESKKMHKYILKQQFESFSISNSEGLLKGYDRFQSLLSQLEIHVDSLSFNDLYNNLRVFELDVKGSIGSSSSTQNVAFVSSSTSSTNDISTAYGVSTSSGHNLQKEGSSSYTDELIYYLFANQSSGPQLDHEDLEQVDEFDLEEMDLKWQMAIISMRLKKSKGNQKSRRRDAGNTGYKAKENRRRPRKQEEPKSLVTLDGDGVDSTGHAEDEQKNFALMAYNNSGSDTKVTSCSKECVESYAKLKKLYDEQMKQLDDVGIEI